MKFLVDMPLSPVLAAWLREQGHDAVHAAELGLNRASDADLIARAQEQYRTIVTADLDYPRLLALARLTDPSLILFREGDWSDTDVIARMGDVFRSLSTTDIAQSILVVDRDRIRRRRLPINR
jgi:predicted nuclease of predicted toxin-antitoxin system